MYVERLPLAALFPLAVALLWVYARWLKRMPFWGNLLVSLFCAGVVALLWLAETEGIARLRALAPERAALLQVVFWAFAALAFLANLFREIVKDLEDLEGDAAAGARTLPVVWGPEGSRRWAFLPGVLLILLMVWGGLWLYGRGLVWSGLWAGLGVVGLQAGALLHLGKAKSSADYGAVSRQAKLVMGGGLLLLGIILLEL
ncbi:MAG: hypothetical protein D6765_01890 [Bacteroidetes bacterium]|nr:MAG: hypothetical protein D6765_01890 [Bacteroidota bacterium]